MTGFGGLAPRVRAAPLPPNGFLRVRGRARAREQGSTYFEVGARRFVALLDEQSGALPAVGYVEAATVGCHLDAGQDLLREHIAELGAAWPGDTPKGTLRCRMPRVETGLDGCRVQKPRRRRDQDDDRSRGPRHAKRWGNSEATLIASAFQGNAADA